MENSHWCPVCGDTGVVTECGDPDTEQPCPECSEEAENMRRLSACEEDREER